LSRNYDAPTQNGIDFFSIGAHPWKLDMFDFERFRDVIVQNKYDEKFFGIGEIGLDRIKGIELGSQIKIFEEILYFAQEEEIKRILIHCVRSYEEIIQSLKSCKYSGQIIFHDYNGGPEVTEKILKLNSYFSFGANLLRENSKAQKVIQDIPQNRIFFESDEKDS